MKYPNYVVCVKFKRGDIIKDETVSNLEFVEFDDYPTAVSYAETFNGTLYAQIKERKFGTDVY